MCQTMFDVPDCGQIPWRLESLVRGVPQGSILDPALFIVFLYKKNKFYIYADNTLYISFGSKDYKNTVGALNENLSSLVRWLENNSLLLNADKLRYMWLDTKKEIKFLPSSVDGDVYRKSRGRT